MIPSISVCGATTKDKLFMDRSDIMHEMSAAAAGERFVSEPRPISAGTEKRIFDTITQGRYNRGIGGAPTRASTFPSSAKERKERPVGTGVLDYFPDALIEVAKVSFVGNEQHNPGQPLHWDRSKSGDEADALIRHFLQRGSLDDDGIKHSAKLAWRALALLQKEIETENERKQ